MDVAVKAYKESEAFTDAALKQSLLKEANVLLNLHCHRGIPKLLGVVMEIKPYCLVTSFHGLNRESSTVNAILKTGASCLMEGMPKGKEDWFKVLCSLGDALLHIHITGYVYGDIKTENVLVEEGLVAVITDFEKCNKDLSKSVDELNNLVAKQSKELNDLEQYGRRECIELSGVPLPEGENAEEMALKIFKKIGVELEGKDVVVCHRLRKAKGDPVLIVKLLNRKNTEVILRQRKNLKGVSVESLGFPADDIKKKNKIFINESLTKRNKNLFRLVRLRC
eukprot:gene3931-biopygen2429